MTTSEENNDTQLDVEKQEILEGKAKVFTPKSVFYNPVQEFNRDLTIAVLSLQARQHFKLQNDKKLKVKANEAEKTKVNIW